MTAAAQWLNETFASFDYSILEFFHGLNCGPAAEFFNFFFKFITLLGEEGLFLIILSLIFMLFRKTRKIGFAMLLAIIFGSLITNVTVKPIVARPRPFQNEASEFFNTYLQWWKDAGSVQVGEKSFPSGHTTSAMAAMAGYFFVSKKKQISWLAFVFAVFMGFSRIFLCVHYPSDVVGGLVAGLIAGLLAACLINLLYSKNENKVVKSIVEFDIIEFINKKKQKAA